MVKATPKPALRLPPQGRRRVGDLGGGAWGLRRAGGRGTQGRRREQACEGEAGKNKEGDKRQTC